MTNVRILVSWHRKHSIVELCDVLYGSYQQEKKERTQSPTKKNRVKYQCQQMDNLTYSYRNSTNKSKKLFGNQVYNLQNITTNKKISNNETSHQEVENSGGSIDDSEFRIMHPREKATKREHQRYKYRCFYQRFNMSFIQTTYLKNKLKVHHIHIYIHKYII